MTRDGERETDGAYGDGTWLPGGYAAERDAGGGSGRRSRGQGSGPRQRPRASTQTSPDDDSQTGPPWEDAGPPWEEPGWGGTGMSGPDPGGLAGKHPSDPLPSLPSQPLHEGDYPDNGYFGDPGHEPGYPGHEPGYPGHEPGYPGVGGHPEGGYAGAADG